MRALLVSSRATFVPRNYDSFVVAMARCPQIAGLVVIDNASLELSLKGMAALAMGARAVGLALAENALFSQRSERRRRRAYAAEGKRVWTVQSVNDAHMLEIIRTERIDLIVNARTRCIFEEAVLRAPRLGCINVHHGLLPDQRGVMCDLWALFEGNSAGFSIHQMTSKIDDGDVLRVVPVSRGEARYAEHLLRSAEREVLELTDLLGEIERVDRVSGAPNVRTSQTVYRKNPTWHELREMRARGLEL